MDHPVRSGFNLKTFEIYKSSLHFVISFLDQFLTKKSESLVIKFRLAVTLLNPFKPFDVLSVRHKAKWPQAPWEKRELQNEL